MKKHELLKYAYDNYPKGTVARFGGKAPDHVSTGKFTITDLNHNGNIQVMSDNGSECFYCSGEWAVPVAPSILSGKCAIQVNNEREFNLLMEHYEAKGWKNDEVQEGKGYSHSDHNNCYDYKNHFRRSSKGIQEDLGYTIIPFADFAKEVGIEAPLQTAFITHDDVPVFVGDTLYNTFQEHGGQWCTPIEFIVGKNTYVTNLTKIFSTKSAAEAWIAEHNKPKFKVAILFTGMEAHIYGGEILIKDADKTVATLMSSELEDMLHTYKSLQP
jgi:hypothetical protein